MIHMAADAITFIFENSKPQETELRTILEQELPNQDFEFLKEH